MSAVSQGAKFKVPDGHVVVLLRKAEGVSIVQPRETPYPVRLEVLAPDGTMRGSRDYFQPRRPDRRPLGRVGGSDVVAAERRRTRRSARPPWPGFLRGSEQAIDRRELRAAWYPGAVLPTIVKKILGAYKGDILTIAELADQASGGHVADAFKTSEEKLKSALDADTRDAVLELMKLSAYNFSAIRVVFEILDELLRDEQAMRRIDEKWSASTEPRPNLRDVVVGATSIAPAYASTTGPLRRLYIQALRGSYVPEIYTFGFGPELLDALVAARLVPADIAVLAGLEKEKTRQISLASHGPELESFERLARGDFVEMLQESPTVGGEIAFITHRTQARRTDIKVRRTDKGSRLLAMIKAGRGEG